VVERYLQAHPEAIEKALQQLQVTRDTEARDRVRLALAAHQAELLSDPSSPVSGNPSGDVTLVEFFDYRCGYCKRAADARTHFS
jgi:protein-disulfide isomerase